MNKEQELAWTILKHGPTSITATVQFTGDGTATIEIKVYVNALAQSTKK